jgi:hypothetical protein
MSQKKAYFRKVKKQDKVIGLIYGNGIVKNVLNKDDYYYFEVEYENNQCVFYTIDGIPNWGNFTEQTVYYENDIKLFDFDFSPLDEVLSKKKIIKLRDKNKLEVRLPSGFWDNYFVKKEYSEELLEQGKLHLFRKKIKK